MLDKDGKPNDAFKKRAATPDQKRDEQISMMVEKYEHVKSFLSDKKDALERKFAAQQLGGTPSEQQIDDALHDPKIKALVDKRVQDLFLSKKIVGSDPTTGALSALEHENTFTAAPSKETKEAVKVVDTRKKEVMGDKDVFTVALASTDINKDETAKK